MGRPSDPFGGQFSVLRSAYGTPSRAEFDCYVDFVDSGLKVSKMNVVLLHCGSIFTNLFPQGLSRFWQLPLELTAMTTLPRRSLCLASAVLFCLPLGCSAAPSELPDSGGDGDGDGSSTGGTGGDVGATGGSGGAPGGTGGDGGQATGGIANSGGGPGGTGGGTGGLGSGGTPDGSGGAPQLGAACDRADILCMDFESYAAGAEPSGDPWDATVMCYDGGYSRTVEAAVGVDGSQGFVTSGASSSANTCALVTDLGTLSEFWVTAHIKIVGTTPDAEHEVTFFELGEFADVDDPELRIGYRGDNSCSNSGMIYQGFELGATKGLMNGEDTGCTGSKTNLGIPTADEWYCIEVHVTQGGGTLTADMIINDTNQDYLLHSSPVTEIGGAFEARYLKVGQQSYTGSFNSVIIDNLSVSSGPVGCEI